jgi:sugar/nucleoside kinase (ribokinase family)
MKKQATVQYFTSGGMRIDYVITADRQVHLREMGGNAIYSAVGARIWGASVGILSRVGENYPQDWLTRLEQAGIGTAGIRRVPGWQDMRTFYRYLDLETRVDTEPARHFAELGVPLPEDLVSYVHSTPGQDGRELVPLSPSPDDLPSPYLWVKAAHLSPMPLPAHSALCTTLASHGVRLSLDPGERYMKPQLMEQVLGFLRCVEAFLPSEQEVQSLLGLGDPWQAALRFAQAGPPVIVIKAGRKGSFIYDGRSRRLWNVPAYPTRVVDVTGAGDAYCGGFMVGYQETGDPVLAGCYGAVSASFVLQGLGALYALEFSRDQAQARLDELRSRVRPV